MGGQREYPGQEPLFAASSDGAAAEQEHTPGPLPLAARMRPQSLDEIVGQEHLLAPDRALRRALAGDQLPSMILWGPPGSGKTTLGSALARASHAHFVSLSAVLAGVTDLRKATDAAQTRRRATGQRTLLFVDEVHRWNRAQQDAILPPVENGTVTLIGATTENPSFALTSALLSRARVFVLHALTDAAIELIVRRALTDPDRGLGTSGLSITPDALSYLVNRANGDARSALNGLELAAVGAQQAETAAITLALVEDALQQRAPQYDRAGDEHYDTISAFIKSVRGSDPDAALYWLARMLEAGEDLLFVARRLVILAGEDVGLADPQALPLAVAAQQAALTLGLPEATYPLAEATLYLALAPKSNSVGRAYARAQESVQQTRNDPVPLHLRNAPTRLMQNLGSGRGYVYPHNFAEDDLRRWRQRYLPASVRALTFYEPGAQGYEGEVLSERHRHWADARASAAADEGRDEIGSEQPHEPDPSTPVPR